MLYLFTENTALFLGPTYVCVKAGFFSKSQKLLGCFCTCLCPCQCQHSLCTSFVVYLLKARSVMFKTNNFLLGGTVSQERAKVLTSVRLF